MPAKVDDRVVETWVRLFQQGIPIRKIAEMYGVAPSTVSRRIRKWLEKHSQTIPAEEKPGEESKPAVEKTGEEERGGDREGEEEREEREEGLGELDEELRLDSGGDEDEASELINDIQFIDKHLLNAMGATAADIIVTAPAQARKVVLDPVILLYYGYAKHVMGFKGGLDEFIRYCVYMTMSYIHGVRIAYVEYKPPVELLKQVIEAATRR